ncbi:GNAT family N-acetyltransferase [Streptomyces sp. AC555_RSS877]|uniref:GNAT family N-acetyltransferase n=1 Tax=Streptomyces sp. AC555_RSS877 TaxID=2823688 RepID=UPI001C264216|nr:GNAT family N-acetyltransferase [Streptomyces sp. AC555_RSS877]
MNAPEVLAINTPACSAHVTTPAPRETWWELAGQDANTYVSQTPAWLDCLCASGPYRDASRLYEFEGGGRLVLPLSRRRRCPKRLDAEESWPADWGIGGPVSSGEVGPAQARAVFDDLARRPAFHVGVRFRPGDEEMWASAAPADFRREPHTTQALNLDGGFTTVWERRFHQRARRAVRRAEGSEVEVQVDRTGRLIPAFYELYEQSIVRWAAQQHEPLALARWRRTRAFPLRQLEAVAAGLGESCAIWMAWHAGEPAAAIVVLRHGHHAKLWRGAMNRELAHPVRANHLLHRLAIEDACAAGCRQYDMGESRPGSSLAAFKESFGADSFSSPRYFRERLPVTAAERRLRAAVKHVIRFRDA